MTIRTYGSLFAGVGGIDLGFDSVGLECLFQVEIDSNCLKTLEYHWPNAQKFEDVTKISGHDLPPVDVISFGSPCQDLSIAGKRAGLDGERSGLFHQAVRIIKEMREKTNGQYPKWAMWENVTGALSSNGGADFGQVLHEMDEAGACFSEWAVLDAQYFGVPQRRRRIFLLSVFDPAIAGRCPSKILPVQESSTGDSKKNVEQQEETSRKVASCLRSGGKGGGPSSKGENLVVQSATILDGTRVGSVRTYDNGVTPCLTNRMGTGGNTVLMVAPEPITNIRRLTPLECERLMGWPDNHTLYRSDGKQNSDSTRYRMCGNGVTSPVVSWIAKQIINI